MVESDFGLCASCWRETSFIGGTVCESCGITLPGESDGYRIECDDCMRQSRPWKEGRAALLYEGYARKLILSLKHGDQLEVAKPAGLWMAQVAKSIVSSDTLVVPVPLHWTRFLKRRYNQSALLAKEAASQLRLRHGLDVLIRHKRTETLDGKNAEERFDTVDGAISVRPRHKDSVTNGSILLVDDVMTTGATLSACTDACYLAGAREVSVLALARVAKDH